MSMYRQFKTDTKSESQGIILDYEGFRVTVARAGGANKKYDRVLEARSKASGVDRAFKRGAVTNKRAMDLLKEVYAEAVVLNWEVRDENDEWQVGIENEDGDLDPFSSGNVLRAFRNLHDLFLDIMEQSNSMTLFRAELREELAGNL